MSLCRFAFSLFLFVFCCQSVHHIEKEIGEQEYLKATANERFMDQVIYVYTVFIFFVFFVFGLCYCCLVFELNCSLLFFPNFLSFCTCNICGKSI